MLKERAACAVSRTLTTNPRHDGARRGARHQPAAPQEDAEQRRRSRPQWRGRSTPGSAQDFTVNVGDRIFFDTDSSSIRADAQATLAKQAQWLNQYEQLCHHHRRPCRRARHPRIQSGARRPPRCRHPRLPHRQGRRRQAPEDDLLRQGASGRGLRRHLLLEPEPPRRHRAQRRRAADGFSVTPTCKGGRKAAFVMWRSGNKIWPKSGLLLSPRLMFEDNPHPASQSEKQMNFRSILSAISCCCWR